MAYIDGGVCAAKGFKAAGIYCGIKKSADENAQHKNDLGLILSDAPCSTACVYTTNKVKGAPIIVTKKNLENGRHFKGGNR
jgi:glutamate N-acetyltransferase/amino-acid N-acetyltransferase